MVVIRCICSLLVLHLEVASFDVIGAGLRHTGCDDLGKALKILGFNTYHSGKDLPNSHVDWMKIMDETEMVEKEFKGKVLKASATPTLLKLADKVVQEGHRAIVSSPAAFYASELHRKFPDSKVILTVKKDASQWFKDMMKGTQLVLHRDMVQAEYHRMNEMLPPAEADEAAFVQAYEKHNKAITKNIAAAKLLVYDPKDGWEPLCKFLGVPVPNEAFPGLEDDGGISAYVIFGILAFVLLVGALAVALTMFSDDSSSKSTKKGK